MKTACEVCGSPLRSAPSRVEIDGAVMMVCGNCTRLGRVIAGPPVRTPHFAPMQSAHRPAPAPSRESEYEIDPDYSLKIRQAREKMGLSQDQLGMMLNEKPSVVRMVENRKLKPDPMLAKKFMHHLRINLLVPLSELEGNKSSF